MQTMLQVPNSTCFFSILFLPKTSQTGFNDVEDTLARANAWLNASQASGVSIVLTNIQTESILTKVISFVMHWNFIPTLHFRKCSYLHFFNALTT